MPTSHADVGMLTSPMKRVCRELSAMSSMGTLALVGVLDSSPQYYQKDTIQWQHCYFLLFGSSLPQFTYLLQTVLIKDGIVLLFDRSASFCLRLAIFVLCRLLYCRLTIFGWSCNGCRRRRWGYRHRLFISRRIRLRCYVVNFGRFLIGFPRRGSRTRICWGRMRFRFWHLLRQRCPSFL